MRSPAIEIDPDVKSQALQAIEDFRIAWEKSTPLGSTEEFCLEL